MAVKAKRPKDLKYAVNLERRRPFDVRWYEKEDRTKWVLPVILRQRAEKLSDKPFLQFGHNPPISFSKTNLLANRIANGLTHLEVKKGEKVAVYMPKYGMTMESGLLVEWLVQEGDQVQAGDSLAVIETEKVNTELEAPASGTIAEISVEADSEVPVGGIIAYIEKS